MSTLSFDEMFGLDDVPAPKPAAAPATNKPADQLAFFVEKYAPIARAAGERLGVEPELLLGQWGLETGWGRSVISDTHNLGNIKDFSGKGPKARDNMTGSTDSYRQYESPEAFAEDFSNLIGGNKRYASALGAGGDAKRYFAGLKQGGYAEDPAYVAKGTQAANMVRRVLGAVNPSAETPKLPGEPTSRSPQTQFAQSPMTDEEMLDIIGVNRMAQPAAPMPERSVWQAGGDLALGVAQGGLGAIKAVSDIAGADNPVSQFLDDGNKALQESKSERAQRVARQGQQRMEDAKGEGTMAEIGAYLDAVWDAPLDMTAQAAGSFLPFLFTGGVAAGARALSLANAAKTAGVTKKVFLDSPAGKAVAQEIAKNVGTKFTKPVNTAVGVAMGLGGVKGQQYETTLREAKAAGKSDEEAKQLATEAQAYGNSVGGTLQQIGGAALGGVAAATGPLERALSRIPGAAPSSRGILGRAGMGALKESFPEGGQAFQQAWAGNEAAIDAGVMDPSRRFEGAAGQAVQEAVLAAPMGGIAGGMEPGPVKQNKPAPAPARQPTAPVAPPVAPATPPVTPTATAAGPTASTPTASPLDLGDAGIDPAMAKLSDEELQAMMADVEAREEDATDDDWVNYSAAMAELDRRKTQPAPAEMTSAAQVSGVEKQPEPPENSAVDAINFEEQQPAAAQDVAPSAPTVTPAINNLFGEVQAEEVPAPDPAPSTEPEPAKPVDQMSEAELRERVAYIGEQAKMNGGWSKPLIAERNKVRKALEAITRKAAPERAVQEPQAADQPQQGENQADQEQTFAFKPAAEKKAREVGGTVDRENGRYVVRMPQNMSGTPSATMGTPTDAKAGPGFTAADVVRRDPIAGQKINDEWTAFAPQSGTLGIPRAEMPQVKAQDRGAMVNFLKARGIYSSKEQLPPTALKPTQAEFSPAKVQEAADRTDGDRSIIVSADGHVVDGHHQWLAQRQKGEPINVIRLNQPINQVLDALKQMPSAQPEEAPGADSWDPEAAKKSMSREKFIDAAVDHFKAKKTKEGKKAFLTSAGFTELDFRRNAGFSWDETNKAGAQPEQSQDGAITNEGEAAAVVARASQAAQDYNTQVDGWNAKVEAFKTATPEQQEAMRPEMEQAKADLEKARQASMRAANEQFQKQQAEQQKKNQAENDAKFGAMPNGTRIGIAGNEQDDRVFWEKTGQNEWTRNGIGSARVTKTNAEMEGGRVISAPSLEQKQDGALTNEGELANAADMPADQFDGMALPEQIKEYLLKPSVTMRQDGKTISAKDYIDGLLADGYGNPEYFSAPKGSQAGFLSKPGKPKVTLNDKQMLYADAAFMAKKEKSGSKQKQAGAQPEQSQDATLTNDGTMPAIDPSTLAAKQRWEQRKAEEKQQAAQNQQENERYNAYVQEQEKDAERRRLQGDNIIQQANGKPFKTETSAQAKLDEFDLADTHAIQKTDKGFVLRRMPPAEQAEQRRKAEGRESYMEAQAAVLGEMGIGETADGEIDATDEQFAEIERRTAERLGRNAQPADSKPNQPPGRTQQAQVAAENVASNPDKPKPILQQMQDIKAELEKIEATRYAGFVQDYIDEGVISEKALRDVQGMLDGVRTSRQEQEAEDRIQDKVDQYLSLNQQFEKAVNRGGKGAGDQLRLMKELDTATQELVDMGYTQEQLGAIRDRTSVDDFRRKVREGYYTREYGAPDKFFTKKPKANVKPNQPPAQQTPAVAATENVAKQPDKTQAVITRADVAAAERIAADMIRQKINGMKAGEVQRIAARFLPSMGKEAPVGKAKIAGAMTDTSAFSLLNPAAELGVELSESVKRALMADREGRVDEVGPKAAPEINGDELERKTDEVMEKVVVPGMLNFTRDQVRALIQEKGVAAADKTIADYQASKAKQAEEIRKYSEAKEKADGARKTQAEAANDKPELAPRSLNNRWISVIGEWDVLGEDEAKNHPGFASEKSARIAISKNPEWKRRGATVLPFDYNDGSYGMAYSETRTRYVIVARKSKAPAPEQKQPEAPAQQAQAATETVAQTESKAPAEPNPLEHTPKQYADAWLRWSAETNGLPLAEVREMQGDEAGLKNIEQRWVDAVVNQAKSGQSLPAKTLDKLLEIRPNTVLPESAIPAGYQRPEARKLEKAQKSAPAESDLEAIFAGLEANSAEADGLKKRKAKAALEGAIAERPDAEVINQVESQFYDMLLSLMERGDLEVNGHKTIHKENKSCL